MIRQKTYNLNIPEILSRKVADYLKLMKFRLSMIVVFSAGMGYLFASSSSINWPGFLLLSIGGFLITGASNALNQVIEKDLDKLMKRTANRPVAAGRMMPGEAILTAGICGVAGILILGWYFNSLAALLGAVSLLMYAFIYTPMKRVSPVAVFIGAIPGALPPVIGWVALTGSLSPEAFFLFAIQFLWQFPHFWAIAWVSYEDYKAAGFYLLPSRGGKDRMTAMQNVIYILFLIMVSLLPFFFGLSGVISATIIAVSGLIFLWQAMNLFIKLSDKAARQLMFGSFIYLPVVLLALIMDKI